MPNQNRLSPQDRASALRPEDVKLVKKSVLIAGHRTSIALEPVFWQAIETMSQDQGVSLSAWLTAYDSVNRPTSLARALRVTATQWWQAARPERIRKTG